MADAPQALADAIRVRYTIERELGRGGMAAVFLAQDLKHRRPVALKVLLPEFAANLGAARFHAEIQVAALLQHPHILSVLDSGEAAGLLWYTIPYVEGESLRARLEREKRLPLEEALRIAREAALALEYAHHVGVVHRDVKPESILLTKEGTVLLTDFGIAQGLTVDEGSTLAGLAMGTPAYMSPEQVTGSMTIDARTDVYSLGVVLYEMLAGEPPYVGPTPLAVMRKRFTESVPSVQKLRPSVPEAVDQAIQRALAPAPADRYPTAAEFTKQIELAAVPATRTTDKSPVPPSPEPEYTAARPMAGRLAWGRWTRTWIRSLVLRAKGPQPLDGMYRVWFGTNRRPVRDSGGVVAFSGDRDQVVRYGTCDVFVPASHKIGSLGSPWWKRVFKWSDDRLKLQHLDLLEQETFWRAVSQACACVPQEERMGVVFIHGFNVPFEHAALRAAQIGCDLQVRGAMAFFSWPSKGAPSLPGYMADGEAIEASEGPIAQFLTNFALRCGLPRVNVIAHSMGSRGVLRAVQRITQEAELRSRVRFSHLVLAAPDVDCAVFKELAAALKQVSSRSTLYVSDRDKALDISEWLHQFPRAGYAPPVTVVPDTDTVHVANVDFSRLGHGYVAEARGVLSDMFALFHYDAGPQNRMGLQAKSDEGGARYWFISA